MPIMEKLEKFHFISLARTTTTLCNPLSYLPPRAGVVARLLQMSIKRYTDSVLV